LTQVVELGDRSGTPIMPTSVTAIAAVAAAPDEAVAAVTIADLQAQWVLRVTQQVEAALTQRLQQALPALVAAQVGEIELLLQRSMTHWVQETVSQALAQALRDLPADGA
jgi:hypothetical protein